MVISVEFGMRKLILLIFSIIIFLLALYPIFGPSLEIKLFDPQITYYIIAAVTAIQIIFVIKMRRPRVF